MKKLYVALLALAAIGSANAQKAAVDEAQKIGARDIAAARAKIQQAMADPTTANDARTYFVAGDIELNVVNDALKRQALNPNDPSVNQLEVANSLINAYDYFMKALPLDQQPNEKGQVKPRFSKKIVGELAGRANDYYQAGATFFGEQKYPEAYRAFVIFADMPEMKEFGKEAPQIDSLSRATAYFNAGLAAYSSKEVANASNAFANARRMNYDKPEAYIYDLACWQYIGANDSTRTDESLTKIANISKEGYQKFGLEQPVFINNLVNAMIQQNQLPDAIALVKAESDKNPSSGNLYGLLGFCYDRAGDDAQSEAAYRQCATAPNADFESLKNAAKKIYRIGNGKLQTIEGDTAEAKAARNDIKTNYYEAALKIAQQAKALKSDDQNLNDVIDSIQYAIDSFM